MIYRLKHFIKRLILKKRLSNNTIKKINIGAGPDGLRPEYADWISVDKDFLDITMEEDWLNFTPGYSSLDNILAEHVWEHLTDKDTQLANTNCYKFLKKGGRLRIAVPDGFNTDKDYIERVKPGGSGIGSDDHKILYNYQIMSERLKSAGFERIEFLEYWDENQNFNHIDWKVDDGFIKRSLKYDSRNKDGKLGYTSLIVDAIK
jgi:predicted SAM-dependent methyltransferase